MRDSVPSGSYSSVCNVCVNGTSRSSLLIESTDSMIPYTKNAPIYKNDRFLIEHFRVRSRITIRYL